MTMNSAVAWLCDRAEAAEPGAVHLANAFTLSLAMRDQALSELLNRGDLNLPDGTPVAWAGRRAGIADLPGRVYGPDLMLATMDESVRRGGIRHYLYGSSPDVVTELRAQLTSRFPGLDIAGTESPPFRDLTTEEETETVQRIVTSGANLVWVGLGTPKQDVFVDRFRSRLPAPLVAVGAAFDFISGSVSQAPPWMRENGLEWAYRLAREPRRLWRRYLIGNAVFLYGLSRGVQVIDGQTRPSPEHSSDLD